MKLLGAMKTALASLLLVSLAGCAATLNPEPPPGEAISSQPHSLAKTRVDSDAALERLKASRGMTLQWISWDYLGPVAVSDNDGVIRISGSQDQREGTGKVTVLGDVVRIDATQFIFRGIITITDTPDKGRKCVLDSKEQGDQLFAVTQNRKYWRLRNFEWCDGLTDYIDIYFPADSGG